MPVSSFAVMADLMRVRAQVTPESALFVARESDESSSTGDSADSKCLPMDTRTHAAANTRPASAPLPQLSDHRDADDVSVPYIFDTDSWQAVTRIPSGRLSRL